MRSRRTPAGSRFSRREVALLLAATPALAQSGQSTSSAAAAPAAPTSLQKAQDDIRQISNRLSQLEVPMNVEPAFIFKA